MGQGSSSVVECLPAFNPQYCGQKEAKSIKTPLVKADMAEEKQVGYLVLITLPGWSDDLPQSNHGLVGDGA